MDDVFGLPSWHRAYAPIHSVTADCVLEWPDAPNCREFPVICPVHGILSYWSPENASCLCPFARKKVTLPKLSVPEQKKRVRRRDENSIREILLRIWGGEDIPCGFRFLNSGTPADSLANRRAAFTGAQLSLVPRGPVIVNSHSLRALTNENRRPPRPQPESLPLGYVYAYLRDLDYFNEWCAVFKSQIRHVLPQDVNCTVQYKEVTVCRKKYRNGVKINVFPGLSCFVISIDYSDFEIKPDLHFGDQILELNHCILQHDNIELSRSPQQKDVFRLRVRPCPFLKWLVLKMGPCPLVTEMERVRVRKSASRNHRDLGFQINNGCVTAVAVGSPARQAGLLPDHHIIEVGDRFVATCPDDVIASLIRQNIQASPLREAEIVVMPQRIYNKLKSVHNLYNIATNEGFNLDAWVKAEPSGVYPVERLI
ncbi:unnamed protein product [Calicophoron daubneyi]|uniref:PDZ domain-containing protein n=1 Tax=Calicophoron daubneyi TaxID=300641 RepID=A0AAV2T962_CALDB